MIREYVDTLLAFEKTERKCTAHQLSNKSKEIVLLPLLRQFEHIERKVKRAYIDHLGYDSSGSIYHTEKWPEFSIEIDGASGTAVDFYLKVHMPTKIQRDDYIEFMIELMAKEKIKSWFSSSNTLFCTYEFKKKNCIERWFDKKIKEAMNRGLNNVIVDVTLQRFIYEIKGKHDQK